MIPTAPLTTSTILVVDDDRDVREATVELLQDMGFEAAGANGGVVALELLSKGLRPAMLIADFTMPSMTGEEFLVRCRALPHLDGVPRVFVSGTKQRDGVLERTGAFAYVSKPINERHLAAILEQAGIRAP